MKVKQKPQLHASWIDPYAREIVETLQRKGFTSYLVGGCVRDLLVGLHPKDFDIVTNAQPNEVKRAVSNAFVIGKRFRLVLVKRRAQQFEVATFRRSGKPEDFTEQAEGAAPVTGDNFFGTPEEDAIRRDFSINALFYDPISDQLIDYAGGMDDIAARCLRMIGDPVTRIIEDPIRVLRALRLSHKLGFQIEPSLRQAMISHGSEMLRAVLPRKREEYIKIMKLDEPERVWLELWDLGLLHHITPSLIPVFEDRERSEVFLNYLRLKNEICSQESLPVEIFAPLVWACYQATEGLPNAEGLLDQFIRLELGLFKAEQAEILSAMELVPKVAEVETLARRGPKRRQGFMGLPQLPLALRLAFVERLLAFEDLEFWASNWPEIEKLQVAPPPRFRSEDRPPRGGGNGGSSGGGGGTSHGGPRRPHHRRRGPAEGSQAEKTEKISE